MKKIFWLLIAGSFTACIPSSTDSTNEWDLEIENDLGIRIPARISFEDKNGREELNIINATDTIRLLPFKTENDSVYYKFIDYNAEVVFSKTTDQITGYWINYEREPVTKRKLFGFKKKEENRKPTEIDLDGSWRTKVMLPSRSYDAILQFRQNENRLFGTMLTNSGDNRFLEGRIDGEDFYVSAFTGNSIFLLEGKFLNDTLTGRLYNPESGDREIIAYRDESFELPDKRTTTVIVNDLDFNLDLKDENGEFHIFQDLIKNRVSIVSIFGTWCPNCVDEVDYYVELNKKFPELKIIHVAFEATDNEAEQQKRVRGFKNRKNIDFQFLIGGKSDKKNVMEKFPMVDDIKAYPTSFLLNKEGEITEIHTGFNGPATGELYTDFKENLEKKVAELLKE